MQILIVTPIHPVQIAEMIDFLYRKYNEHNNIFSIQSMALLAEETLQKEYNSTTFLFATEIRKNSKLLLTDDRYQRGVEIVFGNLDKNTNIKFDHVIGYTGHYSDGNGETFDPYLMKAKEMIDGVLIEQNLPIIEWYTPEDCEHIFPTLHHLEKFLDVLEVKKVELQPKPVESN